MAAHKAIVSVSASVLPDDMKTSVAGQITYDLNDGPGDDESWVYFANNVNTVSQAIMADGVQYLGGDAGDETDTLAASTDNAGFIILKHSGYQGDGTTISTDNLYFNLVDGMAASAATGNLILEPGDVWWCRLYEVDIYDITARAANNTVKLLIYAIVDDV